MTTKSVETFEGIKKQEQQKKVDRVKPAKSSLIEFLFKMDVCYHSI
jgi:hypothetical protein